MHPPDPPEEIVADVQPYITLRGVLTTPDGKQQSVLVNMDIATGKMSYVLVAPDHDGMCPNCNRAITFRGDGRFRCPYCRASKS